MAQCAVATGEAVLATVGVGSCVAILLHDAEAAVAGMAHVLLPEPHREPDPAAPGKYATTAVPHLVREMEARGAVRDRVTARLVGGASMFGALRTATMAGAGERTVIAARAALARAGIPVAAEAVGGAHGRAVRLYAADGRVRVTSYRHPDVDL